MERWRLEIVWRRARHENTVLLAFNRFCKRSPRTASESGTHSSLMKLSTEIPPQLMPLTMLPDSALLSRLNMSL